MKSIKILNEKFKVSNENELILLLIHINKYWWNIKNIIIWNLLMELDQYLEEIVISNNWLIQILKKLDEKRMLLLLVKLSNKLSYIIWSSQNLGLLLAQFSSDKWYKTRIIRNLRERWLRQIIKNADDFRNTIEWLYWDAEDEVFNLLPEKFIKRLFYNVKDITETLYYLNDKNKIRFINIIWLKNIKRYIKSYNDLSYCLRIMPESDLIKLLEILWKTFIVKMFENEDEYFNFLLWIQESREKLFINYFKWWKIML